MLVFSSLFDLGYAFGFNGQEKDNEIAGIGNSNTAQFWQYDTRLGRRWNLDPVDQIGLSNYAVNKLNPIIYNDPNGDDPTDPRTGKKYEIDLWEAAIYKRPSLYTKITVKQDRELIRNVGWHGVGYQRERGNTRGTWGSTDDAGVRLHNRGMGQLAPNTKNVLAKIYNISPEIASSNPRAPNDLGWLLAAREGTYAFIPNVFSEAEHFRADKNTFEIISVQQNIITHITSMKRNKEGEFEVNSTTSFKVKIGKTKYKNESSWFGLKTERVGYRELTVTETTYEFKDGEATGNKTSKTYKRTERIRK